MPSRSPSSLEDLSFLRLARTFLALTDIRNRAAVLRGPIGPGSDSCLSPSLTHATPPSRIYSKLHIAQIHAHGYLLLSIRLRNFPYLLPIPAYIIRSVRLSTAFFVFLYKLNMFGSQNRSLNTDFGKHPFPHPQLANPHSYSSAYRHDSAFKGDTTEKNPLRLFSP